MRNAVELRAEWVKLRSSEKGLHGLEIAERLGVSECQLLSTASGVDAPDGISAVRLEADWKELIGQLPKLGHVKAVTRNPHAVIETEGTYDNVEFFGSMGQSVSSIDLRIFANRWRHGFAFREETKRGVSRGFSFFDASGTAVHKLFLREQSDHAFFDELVRRYTAPEVGMLQDFEPVEPSAVAKPDAEIDAEGLRAAWRALKDTHDFFGLLRTYGVTRTQALRLAGPELAYPVGTSSLEDILRASAAAGLRIMVFVGNRGMIQIYSGEIHKVAPMGPWINVLDPGFDLHVRTDKIASAWVVRKPTVDGIVTSLEIYSEDGEQMALVVGKRHAGEPENADWRRTVEALARLS
jgi:putative hemin transport protein